MPELIEQPDFLTNMERVKNRDTLVPILEQRYDRGHSLRVSPACCTMISHIQIPHEDPGRVVETVRAHNNAFRTRQRYAWRVQ